MRRRMTVPHRTGANLSGDLARRMPIAGKANASPGQITTALNMTDAWPTVYPFISLPHTDTSSSRICTTNKRTREYRCASDKCGNKPPRVFANRVGVGFIASPATS